MKNPSPNAGKTEQEYVPAYSLFVKNHNPGAGTTEQMYLYPTYGSEITDCKKERIQLSVQMEFIRKFLPF